MTSILITWQVSNNIYQYKDLHFFIKHDRKSESTQMMKKQVTLSH